MGVPTKGRPSLLTDSMLTHADRYSDLYSYLTSGECGELVLITNLLQGGHPQDSYLACSFSLFWSLDPWRSRGRRRFNVEQISFPSDLGGVPPLLEIE